MYAVDYLSLHGKVVDKVNQLYEYTGFKQSLARTKRTCQRLALCFALSKWCGIAGRLQNGGHNFLLLGGK